MLLSEKVDRDRLFRFRITSCIIASDRQVSEFSQNRYMDDNRVTLAKSSSLLLVVLLY